MSRKERVVDFGDEEVLAEAAFRTQRGKYTDDVIILNFNGF